MSTLYFPLPDASLDCRPDSESLVSVKFTGFCAFGHGDRYVGPEGCFLSPFFAVSSSPSDGKMPTMKTNTLYIPRCHEGLKSFPMKSFKNLSVSRWQRLCSETSTEQNREPNPGTKSLGESVLTPASASPCVLVTWKPLQRFWWLTLKGVSLFCVFWELAPQRRDLLND